MQSIRSILVVIDPERPDNLALNRARQISGVTQAHLHVLICDSKHPHTQQLNELMRSLHAEGFTASAQQDWQGSTYKTIIKAQQAEGCGLVIKRHWPDNPLKKALLTPDDWKLLRYCPSPVLMVKSERPWSGAVVLAAVDVGNADEPHKALHESIVDHGYAIASLARGELHVISSYPAPSLSAADPANQGDGSLQARYREQCVDFEQRFDIADERLHITEGPADVQIPHLAHRLGAAVTVIGTVARTGIAGALIGNTAEVVLDALESDVLVLKTEAIVEHLEALLAQT
ncbi:universal stress protein [Pseudomonas sp. 21LCFQ010]|uniref:universal stress protein n=1 Tax=Pseudomonas sp. 21LCFQ010 TaxID=2957506 RepID=UPI0020968A6E|nr:universal stress protein [Pseudomonas sp. 21LCFQ010]MCO8165033.1 universal stress protein [Pseudomonas sp. 21LCFQ010]